MNVLEKNLDLFFNNNTIYKNKEFKSFFYQDDEDYKFQVIYDDRNYIHYYLNIPKEKELIIREKMEYEIHIKDSSFDILFHKNNQNIICCFLILIINDIEYKITNENYLEFKLEQFQNLNENLIIITKMKEKIVNYIKKEKEKNESLNIEYLLLEGKEYNLLYNKTLVNEEKIKKFCPIVSKVEIKLDNLDYNKNNFFLNIYEILPPCYKSLLSQKYFEEMPNNLCELMTKYENFFISKDLFNQYKNIKIPKIIQNNMIDIGKKEKINKNKILFHLDKTEKTFLKKKRFKFVLKKIKNNNKQNIKLKLKKKLFYVQTNINKNSQNNPNAPKFVFELEKKTNIEADKNKNIIKNKKINIFKCVKPILTNIKKYPFSINK